MKNEYDIHFSMPHFCLMLARPGMLLKFMGHGVKAWAKVLSHRVQYIQP